MVVSVILQLHEHTPIPVNVYSCIFYVKDWMESQSPVVQGPVSYSLGPCSRGQRSPDLLIRTWPEESWKALWPWGLFKLFLDDGKYLINAAAVESTLTGEFNSPCQYVIYISRLHGSSLQDSSVYGVGRSRAYFGRRVPQALFNWNSDQLPGDCGNLISSTNRNLKRPTQWEKIAC